MSLYNDRDLTRIGVTITGLAVLGACTLGAAGTWLIGRGLIFLYYWFTRIPPN